jgi:hypothetical protein
MGRGEHYVPGPYRSIPSIVWAGRDRASLAVLCHAGRRGPLAARRFRLDARLLDGCVLVRPSVRYR